MWSRIRQLFRRRQPVVIVVPQALHVELTDREKLDIDQWIKSPVTAKVLALMEARHPGVGISPGLTISKNERDDIAAVNYLNRVRGWEMYRNQLLNLTKTPKTLRDVPETFPSE